MLRTDEKILVRGSCHRWGLPFGLVIAGPTAEEDEGLLAIEYDVTPDGVIELVALINAVEDDGADPDGAAWLEWRRSHEDGGLGCAPVPLAELARMEATDDPDELRAIVESVILADRRNKEEVPS